MYIHPLYTEAPEQQYRWWVVGRRRSLLLESNDREDRLRRRKPGSIGRTDGVWTTAAAAAVSSRTPSGQSSAIVWRATLSMSTCSQSRQRLRSSSRPLWPPTTRFSSSVSPHKVFRCGRAWLPSTKYKYYNILQQCCYHLVEQLVSHIRRPHWFRCSMYV